jgi:SAM-dependent methyltransferase
MPHSTPDFRSRARLTELMDEPCTRHQLRGCLRDLARVNRWTFASRPVVHWLDGVLKSFRYSLPAHAAPLRILDVGCGYGDGLRRIEQWAKARRIAPHNIDLVGLDLNPDATAIAAEATPPSSQIQWVSADIFHYVPPRPIHLVTSSLFTHHLTDEELVRFLVWMEQNAEFGWFINDLSRAPIPYHAIRIVAKLAQLHPFVQHDAPVSVARSFVPAEWQALCSATGLSESDVHIQGFKPARLCVTRRMPQQWSPIQ